MGAAASNDEDGFGLGGASPTHVGKKKSFLKKTFIVAGWQKRALESQVFGVVRHAERADSVYALYQGGRWTQTEDFHKWPMDPPLSDAGVDAAYEEVGKRIAKFAQENCALIPVVVTSPYFRCVQTAAEVCRALGPRVRLLIDKALGEVYGPSVMGDRKPEYPTRPMELLLNYCRSRSVKCMGKTIGKWPEWPEDLRSARRRYAERFLTYLQRSTLTRRNFVIVTHGDCVGATVTMMPSQTSAKLEKVEYGGMFLAKRQAQPRGAPSSASVAPAPMNSIVPAGSAEDDDEPDEEAEAIDNPRFWKEVSKLDKAPEDSWAPDPEGDGLAPRNPREFLAPSPPKASDGWKVETHDLVIRSKGLSAVAGVVFTKKLSTLVKNTKFSKKQVETLLGELSDKPLGDTDETINSSSPPRKADPMTGRSSTNYSTLLFGMSDYGTHSEIGFGTQSELGDSMIEDTDGDMRAASASMNSGDLDRLVPGVGKHMRARRNMQKAPVGAPPPKTPKKPAFGRTDEETDMGEHMEVANTLSGKSGKSGLEAKAAEEARMGASGARAVDELLLGAAAWGAGDERSKIPTSSKVNPDSKRTISVETFSNEDAEAAKRIDYSRMVFTQAKAKSPPTSPVLIGPGAAPPAQKLDADRPVLELGPSDAAAAAAAPAADNRGVPALAGLQSSRLMQRRGVAPLALPEKNTGGGTASSSGDAVMAVPPNQQPQDKVAAQQPPSQQQSQPAQPSQQAAPQLAPAPILQNSKLMQRRGLQQRPQLQAPGGGDVSSETPAATSALAVEAPAPAPPPALAPLPGLQNSMLLRRRGNSGAPAPGAAGAPDAQSGNPNEAPPSPDTTPTRKHAAASAIGVDGGSGHALGKALASVVAAGASGDGGGGSGRSSPTLS